jgi:hypothetical protein
MRCNAQSVTLSSPSWRQPRRRKRKRPRKRRASAASWSNVLTFKPEFWVGPGPAFHVYLVPKASIRLKDVMFVDLGGLRAFKGSQRYSIPVGVNLKAYQSVIIWCERFGGLRDRERSDDKLGVRSRAKA